MAQRNQGPRGQGGQGGRTRGSGGGRRSGGGSGTGTTGLSRRKAQRQQERQARRQRRQARRKVLRIAMFAGIGVIALALVIGVLATPGLFGNLGGSSSESRYLTPEERANGPGEHFDGLSRTHLRDGVEYNSYITSPPVGGPHWPAAAAWGIYDEPVPEERQVHDLEHGGVLVQYNTDDQQVVDRLETIVRDLPGSPSCLMMAPYPDMEHTIALTAWGVMQTMNEVDEPAIREFAGFYRDQGPEQLSCRNDTSVMNP